jgi:hypothetical protein
MSAWSPEQSDDPALPQIAFTEAAGAMVAETVGRPCSTPRTTRCTVSSSTARNVVPTTRPSTDEECGSGPGEVSGALIA